MLPCNVGLNDIEGLLVGPKLGFALSVGLRLGCTEGCLLIEGTNDGWFDGDFEIELYEVLTDSDGIEKLEAVEFEKEGNTYFSNFFNIEVDIERVPQTTQEDTSIAELYDFEELENC